MKELTALDLRLSYRTGRDDVVDSFYAPCLEASVRYRRAAGYFTSAGLAVAARGIASLAARNGTMQLVVSPYLEPEDIETLRAAHEDPQTALRGIASRSLADIEDALLTERLSTLAWLVASGRLEIRLALRLDDQGRYGRGLFHEKMGIFSDAAGNHVTFAGSANETAGGLIENFESIKVFCSWKDSEGRTEEEIANFSALWDNTTPGLEVIEFTQASRTLLDRFRNPDRRPPWASLQTNEPLPPATCSYPAGFYLRPYQSEALRAWLKAGGRGILAMATGAGKTLTALALVTKVAERNRPLAVIVVCPYINLCRQWIREMAPFGLQAIAAFEGRDRWRTQVDEGYQALGLGLQGVLAIVTTNATFMSDAFQAILRSRTAGRRVHHMLIADEVHNLGAPGVQTLLPACIDLRLGLSATPERHLDPEGTQAVIDYFGDVVFEYSIDQAIADGRLCSYRYYPQLVTLTDGEAETYAEISERLAKCFRSPDEDGADLEPGVLRLLIKRARLLAGAQNKLIALDRLLNELPEKPRRAIFYCGDGRTQDPVSDEEITQIKAVAHILGDRHHLRVRNFTFRESAGERDEILDDLRSGFLDGVVAIRCLDEGIDLPDLQMGFLLASSTNPRQFIQRRGRLLRNASGKQRALIYDFIVEPPDFGGGEDDRRFNMERRFFRRELTRIVEFCRTAENGSEALASLSELRKKYNLLST